MDSRSTWIDAVGFFRSEQRILSESQNEKLRQSRRMERLCRLTFECEVFTLRAVVPVLLSSRFSFVPLAHTMAAVLTCVIN